MENNLSPLNSQVYLMQEAIKYGQELKKRSAQPSGMPVVSKRRANWMNRIRRSLKK